MERVATAPQPLGSLHWGASEWEATNRPRLAAEAGTPPLTTHTAVMSGLTPNTRYYFRVYQPGAGGTATLLPAQSVLTSP